jgi:hypothetical protein
MGRGERKSGVSNVVKLHNTSTARMRRWDRWRGIVLGYHCPSCHRPAGQPCQMAHPIRVHPGLYRDFHLTRADQADRALRNR